ncbi:hypothetical protein LP414_00405 [Polaromonas sp. P1(28)-13]|nr:hypothetical protein LP414_00405 [Polaromonas sp. P1(28)-13]
MATLQRAFQGRQGETACRFGDQAQRIADRRPVGLPGLRQYQAVRPALEQGHLQPLLERLDLVADGGGRQVKFLRRPAEAHVPGSGF